MRWIENGHELVLMVGPPGCGKTTYCKKILPGHFRISQDEMGRHGHKPIFENAVYHRDRIVVDRINHLKDQRSYYLSAGKVRGYKTKICYFDTSYGECLKRILNRKEHPTLDGSNQIKIEAALRMYFSELQIPSRDDVDDFFVLSGL